MISIVIIEYHSLNEIDFFANSIKEFIGDNYELIISSNSLYSKEEQDRIIDSYKFAKWSFNERNGGFAYGMNEGLKIAKGKVLVVMNPDVKFKTSLLPMISYLESHHEVGIIAPKIVDENGVIQDSFRHYITPWGFVLRHIGRLRNHSRLNVADFKNPVGGEWVIGAFMMCRRDFYDKVGGLSDDYFMYCEDMDWCKRAHLAGYDVVYYPGTTIVYKGTRSARKSWKYTKIFLRSLFTYWEKYGVK